MSEQSYDDAPEDDFGDVPADEAPDETHDEAPDEVPGDAGGEATGHPAVDEVLRSLDALADAPVDEHVGVFEQAHEQLRRTLQGAGDDEN